MEGVKKVKMEVEVFYDDFKPEKSSDGLVHLKNPNLGIPDTLYHLYPLVHQGENLKEKFGDVQFVCMGGTVERMRSFAHSVATELSFPCEDIYDITKDSQRFSMFKVGPVLSVNHGMGVSSLSILMHEMIKLVHYAKCKNVVFFRIGTSGGIGVPPGTVVISNKAVDELLRPYYELHILGKVHLRTATFDEELIAELKAIADSDKDCPYQTVLGATMCALDFYEAQSRLDGAFCTFTPEEKLKRLSELSQAGVVNIEMEATCFASMCRYAGIPGAIVCGTLIDRLLGDQVNTPKDILAQIQLRPMDLILKFIKKRLGANYVCVPNGKH